MSRLEFFNFSDKYPVISDIITNLHQLPTKLIVTVDNANLNKFSIFHEDNLIELPFSNGKVLCSCDGRKTVKEIVDRFTSEGMSEYDIVSVLENAMFYGWIELCDRPQPRKIKISGDIGHFYPKHAAIELTNVCNLFCKHCYREASFKGNFIPKNELFKTFDLLHEKGMTLIELTGGEPLLHPDFFEILTYALKRFQLVAILTNGTLVDEKMVEKLTPYKDRILVGVSIDSATSDFHDRFRGKKGSWEKSCKAVSMLSGAGILTRVAMSITPENMGEIENMIHLSKKLGAMAFSFSLIMPFGRGASVKWDEVDASKMKLYGMMEKKIVKKYRKYVTIMPDREMRRLLLGETNCGAGWRTGAISPKGNFRPCVTLPEGLCDLGNVFEGGMDIFANPVMTSLCETGSPNLVSCSGCPSFSFCGLCWYRGMIGSSTNPNCKWDCAKLKSCMSKNVMENVKDSCIISKMSLLV